MTHASLSNMFHNRHTKKFKWLKWQWHCTRLRLQTPLSNSRKVLFATLGVWLHRLLPRLPSSRAHFIWVLLHVLQGLQQHQREGKYTQDMRSRTLDITQKPKSIVGLEDELNFSLFSLQIQVPMGRERKKWIWEDNYLESSLRLINAPTNSKIVYCGVLDNSFLVNNEKASQCDSLFIKMLRDRG